MVKTRGENLQQERNSGTGHFEKKCGAVYHIDDNSNSDNSRLYNVKLGKKIKKRTLTKLLQNQIIKKRTLYICRECVNKCEAKYSFSSLDNHDHSRNKIKQENELSNLGENACISSKSKDSLTDRAIEIGKQMRAEIEKDVSLLYNSKSCSDYGNVANHDPISWLKDRPAALVQFLEVICENKNLRNEKKILVSSKMC